VGGKVGDQIVFEDGLDTSKPSAHDALRRVTYFTSRAAQAGGLHCSHGHEHNGNLANVLHFVFSVIVFAGFELCDERDALSILNCDL
jgi:hypothetical protein